MTFLFGTAGAPHSAAARDSVSGIERIKELGLGAMELEFVRGVHMGREAAIAVGKVQRETGVALSVHAPYYVNLNSSEKAKVEASKGRILASARIGALCMATIAVFHPAYYQGMQPKEVYVRVKAELESMSATLRKEHITVKLGLETTGKHSAFGNLEEVLALCREVRGVAPCVDFAHLYARSNGKMRTKEDFGAVLGEIEKSDRSLLKSLHIHASGMNYTEKGERNHLNMQDATNKFNHRAMLEALKEYKASGTVICESPNLEVDSLLMQKYWGKL